jgi:hypothetical protein
MRVFSTTAGAAAVVLALLGRAAAVPKRCEGQSRELFSTYLARFGKAYPDAGEFEARCLRFLKVRLTDRHLT